MKIAGAVVDHGSDAAVIIASISAAWPKMGELSHASRPCQAKPGRSSIMSNPVVVMSVVTSLRGHQKVRRRIAGKQIARLGVVAEPFGKLIAPLPDPLAPFLLVRGDAGDRGADRFG